MSEGRGYCRGSRKPMFSPKPAYQVPTKGEDVDRSSEEGLGFRCPEVPTVRCLYEDHILHRTTLCKQAYPETPSAVYGSQTIHRVLGAVPGIIEFPSNSPRKRYHLRIRNRGYSEKWVVVVKNTIDIKRQTCDYAIMANRVPDNESVCRL